MVSGVEASCKMSISCGSSGEGLAGKAVVPSATSGRKGRPWTEAEHLAFLVGMKKLGKGNWRGISRHYVPSRTPTQVASHAQKYMLRLQGATKRKSRFTAIEQEVSSPNVGSESVTTDQDAGHCATSSSEKQGVQYQHNAQTRPTFGVPVTCFVAPMMFAFPPSAILPPPLFLPATTAGLAPEGVSPGGYVFPPYPPLVPGGTWQVPDKGALRKVEDQVEVVCRPAASHVLSSGQMQDILSLLPSVNNTSVTIHASSQSAFQPLRAVKV